MSVDTNLGIRLIFSSRGRPELQKVVFEIGSGANADEVTVSNKNGRRLKTGETGFDWKSGTIAFAHFVLDYKLHGKRNDGFYSIKGDRPSPAASAYDLLSPESSWLKSVEAFAHVFKGRRAEPLAFQIDSNLLPPERIRVFRGESDKQLSNPQIAKLNRDVECQWNPYRHNSTHNLLAREKHEADGSPSFIVGDEPRIAYEEKIHHNLSNAPEQFFGHELLRQEFAAKLAQPSLVVVHEIGGIGKTTFAIQISREALDHGKIPGGAVWIDCKPDSTLEKILRKTVHILLGKAWSGQSPDECEKSLKLHFAHQHTLLVFDNFEAVLDKRDFAKFLDENRKAACILVTTREIHDGLKPFVYHLPALDAQSAAAMFVHEAKSANWSGNDDDPLIHRLCEKVDYLPVGILWLAHAAALPEMTLKQLERELHTNIGILNTDKASLDYRHRNVKACFKISLERLTRQDYDILCKLSVAPHGVGKSVLVRYLAHNDSHQVAERSHSLDRCLKSALLKFENGRYALHPLVKAFLHDPEITGQIDDYNPHFHEFFWQLIDEALAPSADSESLNLLQEEIENCLSVLPTAFDTAFGGKWDEHLLLAAKIFIHVERGLTVLESAESAEKVNDKYLRWLEFAQGKAGEDGNRPLQEAILVELLKQAKSDRQRHSNHLHEINPLLAEAIMSDTEAHEAFWRLDHSDRAKSLEFAERALNHSIRNWDSLGHDVHRHQIAARINLLLVQCAQGKGHDAVATAQSVWEILPRNPDTIERWCLSIEGDPDREWASAEKSAVVLLKDWFDAGIGESLQTRWNQVFVYVALRIGCKLADTKQWAEAARWLEKGIQFTEGDADLGKLKLLAAKWEQHAKESRRRRKA